MTDERVARNWTAFLLIGLVLYGLLYLASEQLVYRYGHRNRFYMVSTAKSARYDYVILGASHAAVFDYDDMNSRLEKLVGGTVMNLSGHVNERLRMVVIAHRSCPRGLQKRCALTTFERVK